MRERWGNEDRWMEFLYDERADLACFKSCSGTQESSSAEYPFHRIRKEQKVRDPQCRIIFSISYSSSLLIRSGGGAGKFFPCTVFSLYGVRRDA